MTAPTAFPPSVIHHNFVFYRAAKHNIYRFALHYSRHFWLDVLKSKLRVPKEIAANLFPTGIQVADGN